MKKVAYSFIPLYHAIKILALESAFWPDIDKAFNDLKTACAKEKLVYIGNNNINYFVSAVGRHLKE